VSDDDAYPRGVEGNRRCRRASASLDWSCPRGAAFRTSIEPSLCHSALGQLLSGSSSPHAQMSPAPRQPCIRLPLPVSSRGMSRHGSYRWQQTAR
jgi:hypothetical protein